MQSPEIQTPAKTKPRRVAPATADIHPDALLRIDQIIGTLQTPALLSVGRTHFYRLVSEGKFPRPTKLGHMSLWRAADVLQAIARLSEGEQ